MLSRTLGLFPMEHLQHDAFLPNSTTSLCYRKMHQSCEKEYNKPPRGHHGNFESCKTMATQFVQRALEALAI